MAVPFFMHWTAYGILLLTQDVGRAASRGRRAFLLPDLDGSVLPFAYAS